MSYSYNIVSHDSKLTSWQNRDVACGCGNGHWARVQSDLMAKIMLPVYLYQSMQLYATWKPVQALQKCIGVLHALVQTQYICECQRKYWRCVAEQAFTLDLICTSGDLLPCRLIPGHHVFGLGCAQLNWNPGPVGALAWANGTLCSLSATLWRGPPVVSWRIGSGRPRSEADSDLRAHKCHSWAIWFWGQIRKCHVPVVFFPQLGIEPRTSPVVSKRLTTRHTFLGAISLFKAFI